MSPDPIAQFARWYSWARRCLWLEFPDAMHLATVHADGGPDGRMVLLKSFGPEGFVFFTNYSSTKGAELTVNPHAALTFYWDALGWQVRVRGKVEKVATAESDQYFASRPRGSQIGAWGSNQSQVIESREELVKKIEKFTETFRGQQITRPTNWGGFRLAPESIEFWQLAPSRLHDRIRYRKEQGAWVKERLCP